MEGKKSDEQRQKIREEKETSSQHLSGCHKNSDELVLSCGAQRGETMQTVGNGVSIPNAHPPNNNYNPLAELTNQSDGELVGQIMGDAGRGTTVDQMAAEGIGWWTKRMDQMSLEEFQHFYAALKIFRERMHTCLQQQLRIRDSNSGETSTSNSRTRTSGKFRRNHRS